MISLWKYHKVPILVLLFSLTFYYVFAYHLIRTDTLKFLSLYTALFICAFKIIKTTALNFKLLIVAALLFRLLFLLATPNLSQDFYRFIWDGQMLLEGFNPYLYTPNTIINQAGTQIPLAQELHSGMGPLSASHFTNYPPLNQLCFVIAALFSGKSILGSVITMRVIIIAADIGTLYFGKKLLERLKLPSNRIFWYILNPFIIIELTGNLHFEGVMIFFLIWSLYLLHSGKWQWAAVVLACAISVKLIPLMFLPLFFWWFKKPTDTLNRIKKSVASASQSTRNVPLNQRLKQLDVFKLLSFYAITSLITLLLFLPFFSTEFISNYSKTVGLWFGNFEFNASIYYVARAVGYSLTGYNEIGVIGKILPLIAVLIILGFSLFKQQNTIPKLTTSIVLVFACYLFLSTTVHPWYIATLIGLCIFTNYKFPLVWSVAIVLSYLAYANNDNSENLWIIGLEYGIIFTAFIWELYTLYRPDKKSQLYTNKVG